MNMYKCAHSLAAGKWPLGVPYRGIDATTATLK